MAGFTDSGGSDFQVYLVKTNSNGTAVSGWPKTYGDSGYDEKGYSVRQTPDGGYIVAGSRASVGSNTRQVYLIKINSDGTVASGWPKTYGESGDDEYGWSVWPTDDGYIVAGSTNSGSAGYQVYLMKTDSNGNKTWEKTFGGSGNDRGWSVQQTSDDGYIVAGSTYSGGSHQVYLIKVAAEIETGLLYGNVSVYYGGPVEGATVTIAGRTGVSDREGNYKIGSVPAGSHTATCSHPIHGVLSDVVEINRPVNNKDWVFPHTPPPW